MQNKMYIIDRQRVFGIVGLVLSSFLFLLILSPYTTLLNHYYGYDTAIWNVIGKGIAEGLIPYRDLFDHKGPFLFFIYGVAWKTGYHREVLFVLQWLFLIVDIIYIYKLCRLILNKKKAVLGVVFFYFLLCATIGEGGMCEEWSLPFIVIPLYYAFRYIVEKQKEHPSYLGCVYGICFGVIAAIRLNNGLPICVIVVFLTVLLIIRKKYIVIGKNAAGFMLGMIIPWIPIIVWYAKNHALSYLWWGAFEFNFMYAANSDTLRTKDESLRLASLWLIIIFWILWTLKTYREHDRLQTATSFMLSSVVVTIGLLLPGAGFMHYFMVLIPYVTIGFCYVIANNGKKKLLLSFISIVLLCTPFTWDAVRNAGKNYLFITKGYYDTLHQEIDNFMGQIPQADRDSVWGNGSGFSRTYCIVGITPCFQYFDNSTIHFGIDERMLLETQEMFETNPPKWIVVANPGEPRIEGLQEFVQLNYELVDELNGEKTLQLYRYKKSSVS